MAAGFDAGSINARLTLNIEGLEKSLNAATKKIGDFASSIDARLSSVGGKGGGTASGVDNMLEGLGKGSSASTKQVDALVASLGGLTEKFSKLLW